MLHVAAAAMSLQSCLTLCDPIDSSPPGSAVPGILQARTLEWVAISFSNAWKWKVKVKWLSRVQLLATPWTAAHQAPLSTGFSRQEYWTKSCWTSPIIREIQIKLKEGITSVRMAIVTKTEINVGKHVEKRELYYTIGWDVNQCRHYGKQYEVSLKNYIEVPYDPAIIQMKWNY